ncbi:hypothetical protein ACHAXA_009654 [Cyclostephanos tholiformis]|uniref:HSF-type DNA-binding domain-containing protein n=1 Tax=Cyclostephanos tholiformis TaxID=382380 RepID=A0ABD3R4U7_9STRA
MSTHVPSRRMDHTYRDYAYYSLENLPAALKTPSNFPSKLHHILSDPENHHIISWMPHGRAWKIHNKDLLISEVVPRYFVQSKYQSFARQLNGWGFKRLHQAGNDFNAYYHEYFLRGMPQLAVLMKRVSPNQGRTLPHLEGEPNFYDKKYTPLPPLGTTDPNQRPSLGTMGPNQFPCPPPPMAMGAGYAFPPAPPAGYYDAHPTNDFSSYHQVTYPPPPPPSFYDNPDNPHAAAYYASNMWYPSYHPCYPVPFAPPLGQYPHFYHHSPSSVYSNALTYDDVSPPGTPVDVKDDEARSSPSSPAPLPQASFSASNDTIEVQRYPLEDVEVGEDSVKPLH